MIETPTMIDRVDPVDELFDKLERTRATSKNRTFQSIENWAKRKYQKNHLPHSTVHHWFSKKLVPEWPQFCLLLECFEEDVRKWKDLWWHAYNGQQPNQEKYLSPPTTKGLGNQAENQIEAETSTATQGAPFVLVLNGAAQQSPPRRRWPLILGASAAVVILVAAIGIYLYLRPSPTDPGTGTGATRCMQVTAKTARVFKAPDTKESWATWTKDTKFWADTEIQNSRYRTPLRNGQDGWITTNPKYVTPAHGCP